MLPRVIVFNAVSLDSYIDGFSADIGQFYALTSHWKKSATLAGSGTILAASGPIPAETDEVSLLIHPCLVGERTSRSFFRTAGLDSTPDPIPLRLAHSEAVGEGLLWLRYDVIKTASPHEEIA